MSIKIMQAELKDKQRKLAEYGGRAERLSDMPAGERDKHIQEREAIEQGQRNLLKEINKLREAIKAER